MQIFNDLMIIIAISKAFHSDDWTKSLNYFFTHPEKYGKIDDLSDSICTLVERMDKKKGSFYATPILGPLLSPQILI